MWLFVPFLFRLGITVRTIQGIDFNSDHFEIGKVYETDHAKFKRVGENSCLFRYRHRIFQVRTAFPIKGEILRNKSGVLLIWRLPLGSFMFYVLWLLGWVCLGLSTMFHESQTQLLTVALGTGFAFSVFATLAGVGFAWFIYASSAIIERKRAGLAFSELQQFSFLSQLRTLILPQKEWKDNQESERA